MALGWLDYCELAAGCLATISAQHCWRWLKSQLAEPRDVAVRFSPRGGCQDAIVRELEKARKEILVQAYSFTADPLTYALVNAWNRGVNVHLLLDKSNESERYSDLNIFLDQGLHPHIDHAHAIAHNKIMIIDQKVVVTGSYNFTNQAEGENAENLLIFKGYPELAKQFRRNFLEHKSHSKPAVLKDRPAGEGRGNRRAA
jgi:phosphatidylserine/phosphatidylglycerophosphate/cardiolipin synthase-like enzyme